MESATRGLARAAAAALILAGAAFAACSSARGTHARDSLPLDTAGTYTYHGCPLYASNDWFTTNLRAGASSYVPTTVDPNSARIIGNLQRAYPNGSFAANTVPREATVNLVPPIATTAAITRLRYGFSDDPYKDNGAPSIPISAPFFQEGLKGCTSTSGDCHVVVLNTRTCVSWETYIYDATSWDGKRYIADAAYVHNLRHPYNDQYRYTSIGPTAAHTPLLGTTDWGEEAVLGSIPHIVGFRLGLPGVANGGYVAPATGGQACKSFCTYELPYGARLRLHAGYSCPDAASYPQAHLICTQMKTYGAIFDDTVGVSNAFGVRLGTSSDGSNPWRAADYEQFLARVKITDFDVMRLGTIH